MSQNDPAPGFDSLELPPALITALESVGYETPTPIQLAAIPPLLAGADLLGQLRPEDLDRDFAVVLQVVGSEDDRHASAAHFTRDDVPAFESRMQGGLGIDQRASPAPRGCSTSGPHSTGTIGGA